MLGQVQGCERHHRGLGSSGCRRSDHLTQECEYLSIEPLGDLRGGRIVIGSDLAADRVVRDTGSPIRQLLDQDGDRRVRAAGPGSRVGLCLIASHAERALRTPGHPGLLATDQQGSPGAYSVLWGYRLSTAIVVLAATLCGQQV